MDDMKSLVQNFAEQLKEAHKKQDLAAIDSAMASLNSAWTAASEELYKATQQAGAEQPTGGNSDQQQQQQSQQGSENENVQDVPYEEVK